MSPLFEIHLQHFTAFFQDCGPSGLPHISRTQHVQIRNSQAYIPSLMVYWGIPT